MLCDAMSRTRADRRRMLHRVRPTLCLTGAKGGSETLRALANLESIVAMPALAALVFGLQLLCLAHVMRTGRRCQWVFIILALPFVGCWAYFLLEIVPDLQHSRAARQAVRDIGAVIDPERDLREMAHRLEDADTVENRAALAEECLRCGRAAEARELFQSCLAGIHATDAALMLGLARSQFALADFAGACTTLDRVRAAHPDLVCPSGHLLYARSKEQQGEIAQALIEYAALAEYYPGEEARCRLALLLQKTGRVAEAKTLFEQVVRSVARASKLYHRTERDWYEVARRNLTD